MKKANVTKSSKKKKGFNMYAFMNKNKKRIVGIISMLIVITLVLGMFSGVAYNMK